MREPSGAGADDYERMKTQTARAALFCAFAIVLTLFGVACFSSSEDAPDAGAGSGTGGMPAADGAGSPKQELIDDMDDGDGSILTTGGRVGAWYTYNDATATGMQKPVAMMPFSMEAGGRDGKGYAAATSGSGFTVWGAGMGFNLNDPGDGMNGSAKVTYDAKAYSGIAFWAKAGPGSANALRVNVSDKNTDPAGGVCAPAEKCNDHFGKDIRLTEAWALYTMNFADLLQLGWGQPSAALDVSHLYAVQFQVAKGTTFDIWLDDVAFLTK
jgi:hypothetical protein